MRYLCSKDNLENSEIVILGVPFDGTSSFKPGSRFGPDSIRLHSDAIESYSPYFDKDIENINFYDYGNLWNTISDFDKLSKDIEELVSALIVQNKKLISVGGEHLITLPLIKTIHKFYKDIVIIHVDAHADLREDYLGNRFSHATVIRRVSDFIPASNIFQFGIRSGTKEEFDFAKLETNFYPFTLNHPNGLAALSGKSVYLTIDIDVLDPSIVPGTGTPEPGGVTFKELLDFLMNLKGLNIVAADLVECSPDNDSTGVSSIAAAKIIRELLILLSRK